MSTLSGFCGIDHPVESHARCTLEGCVCIHHRMHAGEVLLVDELVTDPVENLRRAVEWLGKALPGLTAECTDPQGMDLAELFVNLQESRKALQALERDTEVACAQAMLADEQDSPTLRVERRRGADRKAWQHDVWQRDVRAKVLQAHGLKGTQGVLTADGEVLPTDVLYAALTAVQGAHGATAPKSTALKSLGLDVRDYCESSPGAWTVRVTRMADESKGSGDDAAS